MPGSPAARRRAVALTRLVLALGAAAAGGPQVARAGNTDVIFLLNGDRITGEVKGLTHGKLDYSTDDAGRLSVEWDKVARVTSPNGFQVETFSGMRYFGRLGPPSRPGLLVVQNGRGDTLRIADVVEISPISAGFVQRLKSYLDLGLTVARANRATTFSVSGMVEYLGPTFGSQFKFDSYAQGQEAIATTTRNSGRQTFSWHLPRRWSAVAIAQLEQNDELDLDHRFSGGGGMTRALQHSNSMELSAGAGLVGTQEKFTAAAGSTSEASLEGLVAANWSAYRFDSPTLDYNLSLALFPSLTDAGRVRGQLEIRLKYEVFKDFHAGILFNDTFDSRPPETLSKNDYVATFTIGWSYRR